MKLQVKFTTTRIRIIKIGILKEIHGRTSGGKTRITQIADAMDMAAETATEMDAATVTGVTTKTCRNREGVGFSCCQTNVMTVRYYVLAPTPLGTPHAE